VVDLEVEGVWVISAEEGERMDLVVGLEGEVEEEVQILVRDLSHRVNGGEERGCLKALLVVGEEALVEALVAEEEGIETKCKFT
jgi:hypothetical protein